MKNVLLLVLFLTISVQVYGQNIYSETTSPSNMATGVYPQSGPGDNNGAYNWTYPYGTKLSVNNGPYRNFELGVTGYPFGELKLRQWNTGTNSWTNWRNVVAGDANGNVGIGTGSAQEKFQIGNGFTFHDSGHKVMSFGFAPTGSVDLDNTKYAGAVRFDPVNGDLRFDTSSSVTSAPSSRMYINKDGNVGIGTNNTSGQRLTVAGNVNIGGNSNAILRVRHINGKLNTSADYDDLYLNYGTGKHIRVGYGGQDSNMYISGNIGVGTTSPIYNLELRGSGERSLGINSLDSKSRLNFRIHNLSKDGAIVYHTNGRLGFHLDNAGGSGWETNEAMTILNNGDVGIGTDTPDSKLAVNGIIHTKEVKVDLNGWSDFVFESDYKLPTLQEVEQHINDKGHLMDIPSAAEVEQNGIFLGEINSKLLQKIEELTLYTIAQEKEIEEQKYTNALLEEQMKTYEARLKKMEELLMRKMAK